MSGSAPNVVTREALAQLTVHLEAARAVAKLTAESAQLAPLFDHMQACVAVVARHCTRVDAPAATQGDAAHIVMLERTLLQERAARHRLEARLLGHAPPPLRIDPYSHALDVSESHMDALLLKLALVDGSSYAAVPVLQMDQSLELSRSALRHSSAVLAHCRLGARYQRDRDATNLLAEAGDASRDARALARLCVQRSECVALDKAAHAYEQAADALAGALRHDAELAEVDELRREMLHASDALARLLTPSHVTAALKQLDKPPSAVDVSTSE